MEKLILFIKTNPYLLYAFALVMIVGIVFVILKRKWLLEMYKKHEEIILYLICGGLTTVVSLVSYAIIAFLLKPLLNQMTSITVATVLSWIIAVVFAYVVNRIFVFKSKSKGNELIKECINFFKYRIVSLVIDILCMWLFVSLFKWNDLLAKVIDQVIIVILNYIFSKLFIFKEKD